MLKEHKKVRRYSAYIDAAPGISFEYWRGTYEDLRGMFEVLKEKANEALKDLDALHRKETKGK